MEFALVETGQVEMGRFWTSVVGVKGNGSVAGKNDGGKGARCSRSRRIRTTSIWFRCRHLSAEGLLNLKVFGPLIEHLCIFAWMI